MLSINPLALNFSMEPSSTGTKRLTVALPFLRRGFHSWRALHTTFCPSVFLRPWVEGAKRLKRWCRFCSDFQLNAFCFFLPPKAFWETFLWTPTFLSLAGVYLYFLYTSAQDRHQRLVNFFFENFWPTCFFLPETYILQAKKFIMLFGFSYMCLSVALN